MARNGFRGLDADDLEWEDYANGGDQWRRGNKKTQKQAKRDRAEARANKQFGGMNPEEAEASFAQLLTH